MMSLLYLPCCPVCKSKALSAFPSEEFPKTETYVVCRSCDYSWFIEKPFSALSTESGDNI